MHSHACCTCAGIASLQLETSTSTQVRLTYETPPEAESVVTAHGVQGSQEVDDLLEDQLPVSQVKCLPVHS